MSQDHEVDTDELTEFAKHVDGLIADLGETQGKLADSEPGLLTYGLFGQFFAIAVQMELDKATDSVGRYRDSLNGLYESVKKVGHNYTFNDEDNAAILRRQL
jgi:hypothetical protein